MDIHYKFLGPKFAPKDVLHLSDACYAETIPRLLDEADRDFSHEDECDEQYYYEVCIHLGMKFLIATAKILMIQKINALNILWKKSL